MNKDLLIKELIRLAKALDANGYHKEADSLTDIVSSLENNTSYYNEIRGSDALELSDQIELDECGADGYCTVCGNPSKWAVVSPSEPEVGIMEPHYGSDCCAADMSSDKGGKYIIK